MMKLKMSVAVIVLGAALSVTAYDANARGYHGHHGYYGGWHHFGVGPVFPRWSSRSFRPFFFARHGFPFGFTGGYHYRGNRSRVAADETPARRSGRIGRNGWVGPLFWPYAYDDVYDYVILGDASNAFWGYGYGGIYAGLFAPTGSNELADYRPRRDTGNKASTPADKLAKMCGDDSRDVAGLPIERIQKAVRPDDVQRADLDDLANASLKAAQDIKEACPVEESLTALGRLENMQKRVVAMKSAVATLQPAMNKFYDVLSDEQKARFTALGKNRRQAADKSCGASGPDWPTAEIDQAVSPNETQRARLDDLRAAGTKADDMLKAACRPDSATTPPARLEAAGMRLDTMLQAVKTVRSALNDFYTTLNDEQRARFEALRPVQVSQLEQNSSDQTNAEPTRSRRHHGRSIESIIRGIISRF
jgi:hypothetical protein